MNINDYDGVADLYDIYVPATFDIDFFVEETCRADGEVLELMSGSGRVSIPMLQAGVRLTCVDRSAKLNAIFEAKLRQAGLSAVIHCMDVCELDLGRQFERVVIPFNSFAHITTPQAQLQALKRIRSHLAPGGTFICTLANPVPRQKSVDGQMRLFRKYDLPETQGCLLLWIVEKFCVDDRQVVEALQFYDEYDARGVLSARRLLELHFRLSGREEFEALALQAGLRPRALYGDTTRAPFQADSPPDDLVV